MELMNEGLIVFDKEAYVADVLKREEGAPTSIGFLIATPHAKSVHVKEPSLAFARLKDPVQWADEEVQMVFQIAVPDPEQGDRHLEILAKLSRKIIHDDFRDQLMKVTKEKEVLELVQ